MINALMLRDALISAANLMNIKRQEVDALNVFPVPDGDTGTNMSMTLSAASRELALINEGDSISHVAQTAASALLRGARGNSGVILSLIFRGMAKALKDVENIDGSAIALSLQSGSESAYKAVMKPTEGTILTVIRHAALGAKQAAETTDDALAVWESAYQEAKAALADTPNLLPVLKKAGVVDAGGQGLVYIFEGMSQVFRGEEPVKALADLSDSSGETKPFSAAAHATDENITFSYCTEFIVERRVDKDPIKLRAYLESIGDSVVVVDDDEIIKVHLHTDRPDNALGHALEFGPLTGIKIDNMRKQHEHIADSVGPDPHSDAESSMQASEPEKPFGMVAVAAGEGLTELFYDLGVDNVISGGQTMNPSTEDILRAIMTTPARHVFVFPNNKNIIMTAEQAVPLADRKVSVLPTKTIPQGISAILEFDESKSGEKNHIDMVKAFEKVSTGLVTYAARESVVDGKKVGKGEILALEGGKISFVDSSAVNAAYRLIRRMLKKSDGSLVSVFYGEETTKTQADELEARLRAKFGHEAEISVINGGQPVYYFIISVE